jgi:hypothetical protein
MSQQNVNNRDKKEHKVINALEIIVLFFAFLIVLYFLYPKGKLEKNILQEKSNYDLTAIYLQNLIHLQPDNSKLVLSMANTLYQQKKYNLALNLLNVLSQDSNQDIRQQAALTHLNINKKYIDNEKDPIKKRMYILDNRRLLKNISYEQIKDLNSSKTLYDTAISVGDKKSALKFNEKIITLVKEEEKLKWLKNLHYISNELNNTSLDKMTLMQLIKKDQNRTKKTWIMALVPLLNQNDDIDAISQELNLTGKVLADFYLINKKYDKAALEYQKMYKDEKIPKIRSIILTDLMEVFRRNTKNSKIIDIIKGYENEYLDDPKMIKKFLKLYLEADHADYAKKLSLKIIKYKDIK